MNKVKTLTQVRGTVQADILKEDQAQTLYFQQVLCV
jgi:methylmalonyl-CoA mutase N-terminal domain/subunit